MALPPTPTPAAAPMGAPDPAAPAGDMPMDTAPAEDAEPEVIATILKGPDGGYILVTGDEPEPGMEGGEAPAGTPFKSPQDLMKGIMELLNPTEGAEESFGKAFRGEADDTAMEPAAGPMA